MWFWNYRKQTVILHAMLPECIWTVQEVFSPLFLENHLKKLNSSKVQLPGFSISASCIFWLHILHHSLIYLVFIFFSLKYKSGPHSWNLVWDPKIFNVQLQSALRFYVESLCVKIYMYMFGSPQQ